MASSFYRTFFEGPYENLAAHERVSICETWLQDNVGDPDCVMVNLLLSRDKEIESKSLQSFLRQFKPKVDSTITPFHWPDKAPTANVLSTNVEDKVLKWVRDKFFSKKFLDTHYRVRGTIVHNEDECLFDVQLLLEAVIEGLGLDKIIEVVTKRTLAAEECDLLLIYKPNRLPFAPIEMKKPPNEQIDREKLFYGDRKRGNKVAGQIWAEMTAVQLFGFRKLYGMVSTYNHYQLVCTGKLQEDSDNLDAMLKTWKELNDGGKLNEEDQVEEQVEPGKEVNSPEQKMPEFQKVNRIEQTKATATVYGSQVIPNIDGSESNENSALRILSLGTLFILKACTTLKELLETFENNKIYEKMPCRILKSKDEKKFAFGTPPPFGKLCLGKYTPKLQTIYVVHHLGSGATGNCCLGVSEGGGSCCAVKFYHEPGKQQTIELANQEFDNWKEIYGKTGYGPPKARKLQLLQGDCLVMPYLKPIPQSERNKLLMPREGGRMSRIEETLREFAATGYKHNDIKWRHLGYWKRKIFLLDLGDVTTLKKEDINSWVGEALEYLRKRAGDPAPEPLPGPAYEVLQGGEYTIQETQETQEAPETPKNTRKREAPVETGTTSNKRRRVYRTRSTTTPTD